MYPMQRPACPFRQSTSRRHHGTRIGDVCTVCRQAQAHNVSSIRLSTLQPLGISKKPQNARAMQTKLHGFSCSCCENRANSMRSRSLDLLASVFEELRKPKQRLLRLVDSQVLHSLQQVRCNVLVEELSCRASVSDRLFRFDCHWRRRNRAWSRCACSGRRCGCYCDWRCGFLSHRRVKCAGRCVFGRLRWRNSVCESRLYCAEGGLKVLLAAVSRQEPWYLYLRCRLLLHLNIRIDRRIAV